MKKHKQIPNQIWFACESILHENPLSEKRVFVNLQEKLRLGMLYPLEDIVWVRIAEVIINRIESSYDE